MAALVRSSLQNFRPDLVCADRMSDWQVFQNMRLKASIWVQAYLRQCDRRGVSLVVMRHGDDDAGAVYIKVSLLNGEAMLFGPAPPAAGAFDLPPQQWMSQFEAETVEESIVDDFLKSQVNFDPDIWILVVEDRAGRHGLEEWIAKNRKWPDL